MIFSGLQKTSLVNFPGKICTVLFTGGCNLRCSYCYNRSLVENEETETFTEEEVLELLLKREKLIDAVTVTGGEPTLFKDLPEFLQKVRNQTSLLIKLDTNGLLPEVVSQCLQNKVVDYVALDIKTSPSKYEELTRRSVNFDDIKHTITLLKASSVSFELRTTVVPGFFSNEDIDEIQSSLGEVPAYYIQQFVNENTLDPEFENKYSFSKEELKMFEEKLKVFADRTGIKGL